jgi:hypothetical protein
MSYYRICVQIPNPGLIAQSILLYASIVYLLMADLVHWNFIMKKLILVYF